jgi:N-acetylglutamate synthase
VTRELILRIEEAGVIAWPALETARLDGWLWRFSDGGSQRANSVSALTYTGRDIEASIDVVEQRYAARGKSSMFQVGTSSAPADLDERLARRGYTIKDPCNTLVKSIDCNVRLPVGVEVLARATPEWIDCYTSVITPERRRIAPQILARIPPAAGFFALRAEGRIIATALGVANDCVVIAECVATRAEARGQGAGHAIMRGLEHWGRLQGCSIAALQALTQNAPAQALYKSLGYAAKGGYHLRVKAKTG